MLSVLASLLQISAVYAFPSVLEAAQNQRLESRIAPVAPFPEYPGLPTHATFNHFDAHEQLVSVTGAHAWQAPGPNDVRGPCAGLNAAANHGYLPRDGIATRETVMTGLQQAYGLSTDLLAFLQTATEFFDGDPISGRWSIGYWSPKTQSLGALGNLLGNETGICVYGHLKTEGDASITRGDFLAPTQNSNCASYPNFMQELLDLAVEMTGSPNLTPQVMAEHQYRRKLHSISTNPNYFSPAYAGVAFTFGAHMFAWELLANRSAEYPRGILTPETFLSFFSYTRKNGQLQYTYGHERIPDNWYRRSSLDQWSLADVAISTAQQCASYPTNCQVGGNTGTVNSFQGVNLGDVSGGLVNSASDLSDPAKAGCFISQAIQADAPSFLDNVFEGAALDAVLSLIPLQLLPALAPLGNCPNLPKGRSVFAYGAGYPGATFATTGPRTPY